jgi:hypothetical protein
MVLILLNLLTFIRIGITLIREVAGRNREFLPIVLLHKHRTLGTISIGAMYLV